MLNSKSNKNLDIFFHSLIKSGDTVGEDRIIFVNSEELNRFNMWKRALKLHNVTAKKMLVKAADI